MRPSSLGGGRILCRTLSVCLSVCPSVRLSVRPVRGCTLFSFAPSYERTSKIEKLRFSLMSQRHVCTFRHAQRAAYRTAISAAQILVLCPNNAKLVGCGMGMGFAPTWLRQVSPPPASHDHFNHCNSSSISISRFTLTNWFVRAIVVRWRCADAADSR